MRSPASPSSPPALGLGAVAFLTLAYLLAGCDRSPEQPGPRAATDNRTVLTSFYPLTYFAERIAGDRLRIACPCPSGSDPSFWVPSRADLLRFQAASLILLNGAGYERWTAGAALPPSRTVNTTQSFAGEFLQLPTFIHSHGAAGSHTHSGIDGHTWMDPVNARRQAHEIATAFTHRWPADAPVFQAGFNQLLLDFNTLDTQLQALSPRMTNQVIIASHPAYGYLFRRYGWTITTFPLEPDQIPSMDTWEGLRHAFQQAPPGPRIVLFEETPIAPIPERLASELQARAVVFRPCETAPEGENYLAIMLQNIDTLRRALSEPQP